MVDFAGWQMPVQYSSIREEHAASRQSAGLFDISHMGRLRFDGAGAVRLLDRLITRNIARVPLGGVAYGLITNPQGGVIDDVLVYHLQDAAGATYYLVVVNAGNREKVIAWINAHHETADDVFWQDVSQSWAMIAVQGPLAADVVGPLVEADIATMKYYTATETRIAGHGGIVSRTGYTGEDGFELFVGAGAVSAIWEDLYQRAKPLGGRPAGLGCRDTLRTEAGMPLYGHELSETIDPFQAGLRFAVDLEKDFIGRDALVQKKNAAAPLRRIGLLLAGRRVPRQGYAVLAADKVVGEVTSGTFSPTLERPIAMAYVDHAEAKVGAELAIDIRGRTEPARVVELPFYHRRKLQKESRA